MWFLSFSSQGEIYSFALGPVDLFWQCVCRSNDCIWGLQNGWFRWLWICIFAWLLASLSYLLLFKNHYMIMTFGIGLYDKAWVIGIRHRLYQPLFFWAVKKSMFHSISNLLTSNYFSALGKEITYSLLFFHSAVLQACYRSIWEWSFISCPVLSSFYQGDRPSYWQGWAMQWQLYSSVTGKAP